ncbi:5-formyltetrahydrofolate cyclo-ligase [Thermomonas sp.]|uniref:5-formyltetrahydrofolate cyclo-ligase n=1 Tax=Thermomonas sp. TaxID=1971895 RepID=UPI0035B2DC66
MSSVPDRAVLRRELRQRRRDLPAATRIAAAESLANRLLALPFLPASGLVAGYWAMDGEIGLHVFQLRLPPALTYCLPLLHADGSLRFAPWRAGDPLVTNRFGIPEPDIDPDAALPASEMAMLVLPLVGFDAQCNRLGMGGGWYDRSLSFRRDTSAPPWLVGAGFDVQRVEVLQHEAWDVPLDAVCSEAATHLAEQVA